jgi:hypothetical protein
MIKKGTLANAIPVTNILRDDAVSEAFREVSARPELRSALNIALGAKEKYGF